jgi:hypothetical protein
VWESISVVLTMVRIGLSEIFCRAVDRELCPVGFLRERRLTWSADLLRLLLCPNGRRNGDGEQQSDGENRPVQRQPHSAPLLTTTGISAATPTAGATTPSSTGRSRWGRASP